MSRHHPLVQQLGILDEDERPNALVLRPDGSIAVALSGLTMGREKGELIFKLAPLFDPGAVDEKGRKLKAPVFGVAHVRARARVFMALKDWGSSYLPVP